MSPLNYVLALLLGLTPRAYVEDLRPWAEAILTVTRDHQEQAVLAFLATESVKLGGLIWSGEGERVQYIHRKPMHRWRECTYRYIWETRGAYGPFCNPFEVPAIDYDDGQGGWSRQGWPLWRFALLALEDWRHPRCLNGAPCRDFAWYLNDILCYRRGRAHPGLCRSTDRDGYLLTMGNRHRGHIFWRRIEMIQRTSNKFARRLQT